jgi:micrococcal nuclease
MAGQLDPLLGARQRRRALALLALVLAASACAGDDDEASAPPPAPARSTLGVVSGVVDGDTIKLANSRRVRLVQIDAPDLRQRECYAKEATLELERLLPVGTRVRLELDRDLDQVDRHGRRLAYVFVGRTNVNVTLVRRGAASVWFHEGARGRYADRLLLAAGRAQGAGLGLWLACASTRFDPQQPVATKVAPPHRPGPTGQPHG